MIIKLTTKAMKDMVASLLRGEANVQAFEVNNVDLSKIPFDYEKGLIEVDADFAQALREGIAECVREDLAQGESVSAEMWRLISLMSRLLYRIYDLMEWEDAGYPDTVPVMDVEVTSREAYLIAKACDHMDHSAGVFNCLTRDEQCYDIGIEFAKIKNKFYNVSPMTKYGEDQ